MYLLVRNREEERRFNTNDLLRRRPQNCRYQVCSILVMSKFGGHIYLHHSLHHALTMPQPLLVRARDEDGGLAQLIR